MTITIPPSAHLALLPKRLGPRPETSTTLPHAQLTQTAPPDLQAILDAQIAALPGVIVGESRVSVPGTHAYALSPRIAHGPRTAFMIGGEFAHLHPVSDGSLHLTLSPHDANEVLEKGWGEPHPLALVAGGPPRILMIYGPRNRDELAVVWRIVEASYAFARGALRTADAV